MRRLAHALIALVAVGVTAVAWPTAANAHAKFESSTPANGETLTAAPTEVRLDFSKPIDPARIKVSLDNGAQLIDLGAPYGDPNQIDVVVVPITGSVPNGNIGLNFRTVADDGHVVEGRVDFVVNAPVTVTTTPIGIPPAEPAPNAQVGGVDPAAVAGATPTSTSPPAPGAPPAGSTAPESTDTSAPVALDEALDDALGQSAGQAPSFLLGVMRWVSYVGFAAWVGCLLLITWLWRNSEQSQRLRQLLQVTWIALVASSILAVVFQSWLIKGSPGLLLGDLWDFAAGRALVAKAVLSIGLGVFAIAPEVIATTAGRLSATFATGVLALAMAAAGHASTERWLYLGIAVQTAHVLAIGAWMGLLITLALVVLREANDSDSRSAVAQFSSVATGLVGAIVVTGAFQSLRFVGSFGNLFTSTHGRWLLFKLVLVGAMLVIARISRDRVARRLVGRSEMSTGTREQLRRALITEFAVGVATLAVTAMLVVQAPAA
jgi:putative copper export protein/methionine-rich copper-binding protein CopC